MAREARLAERADQFTAFGVGPLPRLIVPGTEMSLGPVTDRGREYAVVLIEEWPVKVAHLGLPRTTRHCRPHLSVSKL